MSDAPASFTCPRCQAVSYNPNDIRERYCGRCHQFADQPALDMGHNPALGANRESLLE